MSARSRSAPHSWINKNRRAVVPSWSKTVPRGQNHFPPLILPPMHKSLLLIPTLFALTACLHPHPPADPLRLDMKTLERPRVLTAANQFLHEPPDTLTSHPVPENLRPPKATPH